MVLMLGVCVLLQAIRQKIAVIAGTGEAGAQVRLRFPEYLHTRRVDFINMQLRCF